METIKHKLKTALQRTEAHFGRQTRFSSSPALDQLVATILSQRTTYANEKKAFDRMMQQFGDWKGIMEAPEDELTQAISYYCRCYRLTRTNCLIFTSSFSSSGSAFVRGAVLNVTPATSLLFATTMTKSDCNRIFY